MENIGINQLVRSNEVAWKPLVEEGVNTAGLWVKGLRYEKNGVRTSTFLLKFEAGASYPLHNHPAGEEAYVLEGEVRFGKIHLFTGDYLYTAPNERHSVYSKTGCVILFLVPQEVEIL